MAQVRTDALPWIHQRCCPRCGYSGWELQQRDELAPYECPNCDEDLYARRALSYAEREGFIAYADVQRHAPENSLNRPSVVVRVLRGLRSLARRVLRI